jgi:small subunit ribosomal protein S4
MGDPKKIRKKYQGPRHPWEKLRIDEEKVLTKEYGLKNKKEIWMMETVLKNYKAQVKKLISMTDTQADLEREQLRLKLLSYGLIESNDALDKVLGLTVKDILERRLQTIMFKKNLAKSVNQARQFIVHHHVTVDGTKMTAPSYLVKVKEEGLISFAMKSGLSSPDHPERYSETVAPKVDKKKEAKLAEKKKEEETEGVAAFDEVPTEEEVVLGDLKKKAKVEAKEETSEKQPGEKKNE